MEWIDHQGGKHESLLAMVLEQDSIGAKLLTLTLLAPDGISNEDRAVLAGVDGSLQVADYPTLLRELNDVQRATIASALNIPEVESLTSGADLSAWEQMSLAVAVAKQACRENVHLVSPMQPSTVASLRCGAGWAYHIKTLAGIILTRSRGGPATGRCGGHTQVSRQAKHYAHKGINALSCDKAFQNPCHSAKREQKYVQQHIRICTHGVKTGLG